MPVSRAEIGAAPADFLRAEQVRMVIANPSIRFITVASSLAIIVLVRRIYPAWVLELWLGASCAVILARVLLTHRYQAHHYQRAPAGNRIRIARWALVFALGAAATGLLWGVAGTDILLTPNPATQLLTIILIGGMMGPGVMANAAYLPAMFGYAVPVFVPACVALLWQGDALHDGVAALVVLCAGVIIGAGFRLNRLITAHIRLRFNQDVLLAELKTNEAAMAQAQRIAQIGSWDMNMVTHAYRWSPETFRILGINPALTPSMEAVLARVHPDDRAAAAQHFADSPNPGPGAGIDLRLLMDDGTVRYVRETPRTVFDAGQSGPRMVGTVQDITASKQAEETILLANLILKTQMEASPDGIMVVDHDRRITSFNRRFAEIWDIPLARLEARDDDFMRAHIRAQIRNLDVYTTRVTHLAAHPDETGDDLIETLDGRFIERHSATLRAADGAYLGQVRFFRDITERRHAAEALDYRDRLLHAVTAATGVAVRAVSLEKGVPEALRQIGERMNVDRILVLQDMPGDKPPLGLRFGWEAPEIEVKFSVSSNGAHRFDPVEMAAWRQPLRDGKPVFADIATAQGAVRDMLAFYRIKSAILVPVYVGGQVWGFIGIDDCKAARRWTASEIETAGILADTAGALIVRERARVALEASDRRFRLLAATANDAIILTGPAGEILQWNPAAERIFGYSAAQALGSEAVALIVRPQDRALVSRGIANAASMHAVTTEFTFLRKDGSEIATEVSVSAMPIGTQHGIICILRDISARKLADEKLKFANLLFKTQMEASPDAILVTNESRRIVSYNQRFADMWQIPIAMLEAGDASVVRARMAAMLKDPANFLTIATHLLANPDEVCDDEMETRDGRFMERHSRTLQGERGDDFGRVSFFRDITARRNAEALALRLARYDVLTGLANRTVFVEALRHAIAESTRGGKAVAVLYLDLDHFKDVNDTLGHPVGDALLQAVAGRLRAGTRATDTVARFGGDEFAVVAPGMEDPADAGLLADKLVKAIGVPFLVEGNTIHTDASIGIDIWSVAAPDAESLLSHADVALYRAKAEGRGTFRFFTDLMDRQVRQRVTLTGELRTAIACNQFFLLYQPQVEASTGKITGLEALVRWQHPIRGVVGPNQFIPVAEATGLIGALGHFVLWSACRQAKAWLDAGLAMPGVCVNVSALQFKTPLALEADIAAALAATGLPAHLLELELTESALMDASREHNQILERLRARGVKLAIDDFGTGFSSLDYLRRFPADHIKIAQTFTKSIETETGDASIVRAVIALAQELDIRVIAEGIATKPQLDLVRSWGCGLIQGFYFARPLPVDEVTALLRKGVITVGE